MLYLKMGIFCIMMLFVPLGTGNLLTAGKKDSTFSTYLAGLCTAFSIYQIICFICSVFFETSLTFATGLWTIVTIVICVLGWKRWLDTKSAFQIRLLSSSMKERTILMAFVLIVLLLQVVRAVTGLVTNVDDCTYAAQATTAIYTDTINQYRESTGFKIESGFDYHYTAMWPILWASVSQLTGIHPAIIMRTILPLFMIPCAYMASYLLFKELFEQNTEKALWGVLLLEISYEIVSCNDGMKQWWLLLCSWLGKSVAPNFICPLLVYDFLRTAREKTKKEQNRWWLIMSMTCIGGCLTSGSCFMMIPFLLGIMTLEHCAKVHDILFGIKSLLCG